MIKVPNSGLSPIRSVAVLALLGLGVGAWLVTRPVALGPTDGFDLPGEDTARVQVGDPAPDFRLPSFEGEVVSLSDYRGRKEVVLVFYRGHW